MATRAILATTDSNNPNHWHGVYVHFDGYPEGWPSMLPQIIRDGFGGDVHAAIKGLIGDRSAGWSVLVADWTQTPTERRGGDANAPIYYPSKDASARFEGIGWRVTRADMGWTEYCYIIDPSINYVLVHSVETDEDTTSLKLLGSVDLTLDDEKFREAMASVHDNQ